jgi:hypothetical protein
VTAGLIKRLAGAISSQKSEETGKPKSWWRWPLVVLLVVLAVVAVVWIWRLSSKERRELARLRHERNVLEIQAEQAQIDSAVARDRAVIADRRRLIAESAARVREIDREIAEGNRRHDEVLADIDRIRVVDLPRGD